jgi:hypothetical protein
MLDMLNGRGGPASTNRRVGPVRESSCQVSYDELGCGRAVDAGMQDECAARRPRGAEVDLGPPLPWHETLRQADDCNHCDEQPLVVKISKMPPFFMDPRNFSTRTQGHNQHFVAKCILIALSRPRSTELFSGQMGRGDCDGKARRHQRGLQTPGSLFPVR